jgi:hypothetical protein
MLFCVAVGAGYQAHDGHGRVVTMITLQASLKGCLSKKQWEKQSWTKNVNLKRSGQHRLLLGSQGPKCSVG